MTPLDEQITGYANAYTKIINDTAEKLLVRFKSNKKARVFLRQQLAYTANHETHEFILKVIKKLESIALNC